MSFLNPVNEPVKRFSSTDVGAPQINYNARVAGDVKAVLKACLVNGYGTKASAGWSIVNEVNHVAEFVSPSAAMSDYRLGIDDTSASSTTWYYQYQDLRTNPASNSLPKNHGHIDLTSAKNGWQLLVSDRGAIFIEALDNTIVLGMVTRVVYWGAIKSASTNGAGKNIAWWSIGHTGRDPTAFFTLFGADNYLYTNNHHYIVNDKQKPFIFVTNAWRANSYVAIDSQSSVEVVSAWYLYSGANFVGEQPAVMLSDCNNNAERHKIKEVQFNGRPVLSVPASYDTNTSGGYNNYTRTLLIALDNWGY